MCFKARFSPLFHLHRQHFYLLTNKSPVQSFPTTGQSWDISSFPEHLPQWNSSHAFHGSSWAHPIPTAVLLLPPVHREVAVPEVSLLLLQGTSLRAILPGWTASVLPSFKVVFLITVGTTRTNGSPTQKQQGWIQRGLQDKLFQKSKSLYYHTER